MVHKETATAINSREVLDRPYEVRENSGLQLAERPVYQLQLLAERRDLYAILDACDAPLVPPLIQQLGKERAVSLFHGTAHESYFGVAPYLMSVDHNLLNWLYNNLWEEPWGIFVVAKYNLQLLSDHFRRFLMVKLPDQRLWYFRYYDPNVLKMFLSTCNASQLREFFGPVQEYGVSTRNSSDSFISMTLEDSRYLEPTIYGHSMLEIRNEQIQMLNGVWSEHRVAELANVIRTQYPDRVPKTDREVVASVRGWIEDAVQWGFVSHEHIMQYVVLRAGADGQREPLSVRLCGYLTIYHQELISGVDLSAFADRVTRFAEANGVKADEGVTWLALILLAARRSTDHDLSWIPSLLATSNLTEEERLHLVHVGAQNRGWIQKGTSL